MSRERFLDTWHRNSYANGVFAGQVTGRTILERQHDGSLLVVSSTIAVIPASQCSPLAFELGGVAPLP